MSLANIKTELTENLSAISGVRRVFDDAPNVVPAEADCPCIVIDRAKPFLSVECETNGSIRYTWHFSIKFLYQVIGVGTAEQWSDDIEPYPALVLNALWGDMTLESAAVMFNDAMNFDVGIVEYRGGLYFGFECNLDVVELVDTTFA